jgi:hypothetical protein
MTRDGSPKMWSCKCSLQSGALEKVEGEKVILRSVEALRILIREDMNMTKTYLPGLSEAILEHILLSWLQTDQGAVQQPHPTFKDRFLYELLGIQIVSLDELL